MIVLYYIVHMQLCHLAVNFNAATVLLHYYTSDCSVSTALFAQITSAAFITYTQNDTEDIAHLFPLCTVLLLLLHLQSINKTKKNAVAFTQSL